LLCGVAEGAAWQWLCSIDLLVDDHGACDLLQSVASGSASGFDMTQSSIMSKGSGSATPYSLGGSLNGTPAAQAYVGQLSFNQQPFNQMYQVI